MVRIATVQDAEQLSILNDEFNGKGETTVDTLRNSIINNEQEVVIVADKNGMSVGFVCVQLKSVVHKTDAAGYIERNVSDLETKYDRFFIGKCKSLN